MIEPRILVARLSSLGDIVHTFPAVAGLRESFPNAEIIWLTHPRWGLLVECSSLATEIWATETRSFSSLRQILRQIRRKHFDIAIDYQGLWKSAGLPFLGGVKRRVGFSSATVREFGVPILYTDRVRCTTTHIADHNGELSARAGARHPVAPFSLNVSPEGEEAAHSFLAQDNIGRYIVLSPGGGWRSKCWPAERFGALCRRIRNSLNLRSIINYGPGEENLWLAIKTSCGGSDPVPYDGDLGTLMALLRHATCIVGGDTGPLHLAVALGTPAVALFGPTNPARNGPYRSVDPAEGAWKIDVVLRAPDTETTHARNDETHPSMLALSVDMVFEAVCRLMRDRG